jgi:hypothetical protein
MKATVYWKEKEKDPLVINAVVENDDEPVPKEGYMVHIHFIGGKELINPLLIEHIKIED